MEAIKRTFGFINRHPIAKRNLFMAYWRFFHWQIYSLLYRKPILVPFVEQTKILAKKSLTGVTGNIYTGLHEFEDMSFLLHLLRKSDLFFDVGANVGTYTLLASGVKGCYSVSFEPGAEAFRFLSENLMINKLTEIATSINKGVGSKKGKLYFTSGGDTTNHILANGENNEHTTEIEIVCLDDYCLKKTPLLMKIDVEGFETEVLNGAGNILADPDFKALIIELNGSGRKYGYNDETIHSRLLETGFRPYRYSPFNRKLDVRNTYSDKNTIYIRDIEFVSKRLSSARSFRIFNTVI